MNQEEMIRDVRKRLFEMQDTGYRDFHARLVPTVEKDKDHRYPDTDTPEICQKSLEKQKESEMFLKVLPHQYYEENNLHGLLIEQIRDYDKCLEELERFLPYIDNWATCDLLALHMMKKHRDVFIREVYRWMESDQPYTIRFGISMLMRHYLDEGFKPEYPEKVATIRSEEYYVNMMRAWYFATALAKQYEKILPFLEEQSEWIFGLITRRSRNPLKATGSHQEQKESSQDTADKEINGKVRVGI